MKPCRHCGDDLEPHGAHKKDQHYCKKPECRIAKYEARKQAKRKTTFETCRACGELFRIFSGGQKWCSKPECQKAKRAYSLAYMSNYGKQFRSARNTSKKMKPKNDRAKRYCNRCGKPLKFNYFLCPSCLTTETDKLPDSIYEYTDGFDYSRYEEAEI